jgi:hypothetical protein
MYAGMSACNDANAENITSMSLSENVLQIFLVGLNVKWDLMVIPSIILYCRLPATNQRE